MHPSWLLTQLHSLQPNQYFVIPGHITPTLNIPSFRTLVSQLNRRHNVNLKIHRDTETYPGIEQIYVWFDPSPKTPKQTQHRKLDTRLLKELSALHKSFQESLDNSDFKNAAQIQSNIDSIQETLTKVKMRPVYVTKGSITFKLKYILEYLQMTIDNWNKLTPKNQLRLRIQTELKLRQQHLNKSNENTTL